MVVRLPQFDLSGRTALVTGSGRGLGRGIAIELARAGAVVAATDLDRASAQDTADAVIAFGCDAIALHVDVTNTESVQRCVSEALVRFSRIDILVNNAGVFQKELGLEQSAEDFNRCLDINVTGMWRMVRALVPHFRAHGAGRIVNISSVGGRRGVSFAPAYCASKAAVISLSQSLALALGAENINVNTVCPGAVATAMQDEIKAALSARIGIAYAEPAKPPLAGPLTPEDIGRAVVFLASDYARNITGQALNVDCGFILS